MIVVENGIFGESGDATVRLGFAEVLAISNSLNEALEAVPDWEFHVRTGVEKADAERLHGEVRMLLKRQ